MASVSLDTLAKGVEAREGRVERPLTLATPRKRFLEVEWGCGLSFTLMNRHRYRKSRGRLLVDKPSQPEVPQQNGTTPRNDTDATEPEAPRSAPRQVQAGGGTRQSVAPRSLNRVTNPRTVVSVTDRHLPILLSTFRGELELGAVRQHDEQVTDIINKSITQSKPLVYVVDARGLATPSAMVRRYWANQINESRAVFDALLGTFIILDSAILRGALTAIVWMTDGARRISYVPSFDVAVQRSNALLEAQGHPRVEISEAGLRSLRPGP